MTTTPITLVSIFRHDMERQAKADPVAQFATYIGEHYSMDVARGAAWAFDDLVVNGARKRFAEGALSILDENTDPTDLVDELRRYAALLTRDGIDFAKRGGGTSSSQAHNIVEAKVAGEGLRFAERIEGVVAAIVDEIAEQTPVTPEVPEGCTAAYFDTEVGHFAHAGGGCPMHDPKGV